MKLKLILTIMVALFSATVSADFLATGTVTKFHVGPNNFSVYLSSSTGCPSNWYYVYNTDLDSTAYLLLHSIALTAYMKGKTISIFAGNPARTCAEQRFNAIDTLN